MSFEIMREFGFVLNGLEIVMDALEVISNCSIKKEVISNWRETCHKIRLHLGSKFGAFDTN